MYLKLAVLCGHKLLLTLPQIYLIKKQCFVTAKTGEFLKWEDPRFLNSDE